jgi:N-methylhydantoinase A/oxoprolinase/acetone carboxylase beta subunit
MYKGLVEAKNLCRKCGPADIEIFRFLNLRYQGQSYELCSPFEKIFSELFHQIHEHTFGYSLQDTPLEFVSIQFQASFSLAVDELFNIIIEGICRENPGS